MKYPPVKDLSAAAVDAKPVDFDWSEGYGETWDIVLPNTYSWTKEECLSWIDGESLELSDLLLDDDAELDAIREKIRERMDEDSDRFTPVMSYYYPLPGLSMKAEDAQTILDNSSCALAVVLVGDEPVMALTGGGMDFSWDICRAYMLLGFLPPTHFQPPEMGGMKLDARTRWVLAGYRRSCQVELMWARNRLKNVQRVRMWLKKGA